MITTAELLRQGRKSDIWARYCGFIDLSLKDFMAIQERLLLEQIGRLSNCEVGRRLLGGKTPSSIAEFRASVPLTTYADYISILSEKNEDGLPAKPRWWLRTSGRTGEFGGYKWVPYTAEMARGLGESVLALFTLAAVNGRDEFPFAEGDRLFYTMAPFPYMSGGVARALLEQFPFTFLPPLEKAEAMPYNERIQEGMRLAMKDGIDHVNAIAVVLVRIAEQFSQQSSNSHSKQYLLNPSTLARVGRGMLRARAEGRKNLLPKDLWSVKGIATGGTDTILFRDKIREVWGRDPVEAYGCTEGGVYALQLWSGRGLVFLPHLDLLEFMPLDEYDKNQCDPTYKPRTVLLDEVVEGGIYEVVITNFLGGVFTRYRVGDLIQIISLSDQELGVALPKMVFHSKAHDVIDLSSFARLTERTIWQAIQDTGLPYADWTARKEYRNGKPYVYIYVEPKNGSVDTATFRTHINQALKQLDSTYADIDEMMGLDPLRVELLPVGAFRHFYQARERQGADLAHLKPPHMQISDTDLSLLMTDA
jgi:hypothetical protein